MCVGKMFNYEKVIFDWKIDNEVKGLVIGIGWGFFRDVESRLIELI